MRDKNICPFSGKICKECALYRGRHHYMCFSKNNQNLFPVKKVQEFKSDTTKKWEEY